MHCGHARILALKRDLPEAHGHRRDLLAVQARHLVRLPPTAQVPEAKRAVKVTRGDQRAVGTDFQ